jgi:2'-5' RNA ligase
MEGHQIRSFIAIELPAELKDGLARLQAEMKSAGRTPVKWVAPQGIHLTLKFLGNVPGSKVTAITGAITKASQTVTAFHLETAELGVFPDLRRPNVFWLGMAGDLEKLLALQRRIDDELEPLGFLREKRAFTPHLTLARLREEASWQDRQGFGEMVVKTHFDTKYRVAVNGICLMKSQLLPGGAVYSRLAEVPLGNTD